MRKRMGGLLLAAGVGVLGLWGNFNQAKVIETAVADAASTVASEGRQGIETFVEGRDIRVTGVVNDATERDAVLAAMNEVEGRRIVIDDLTIIPVASPFTFEQIKTPNGSDYIGFVPSEIERKKLTPALGRAAAGLTLSSGAPDGWSDAIIAGNAGLETLKSGTLTISDKTMTLTGLAANPAAKEAALAAITLPDGFTLTHSIEEEDDGKPFELVAVFDGSKTKIEGKLPVGSNIANMASGRGLRSVSTDVVTAQIEDPDGLWPEFAQTGLAALGRLSEGTLKMQDRTMVLSGVGTPSGKTDAEYLLGALPASLDVTADVRIYDDGQPIVVRATKGFGTGIVATEGKLPVDYNIRSARITDPEVLRTGFLPDETGFFDSNLRAAAGALLQLREGSLEASGTAVRVSGVAGSIAISKTAVALLEDRVVGELVTDITVYDDGKDIALSVKKSEDGSLTATSGKLPFGVSASAFGLAPSNSLTQAAIEDDSGAFDPNVTAALKALAPLQSGSIDVTPDRVALKGVARTPIEELEAMTALSVLPKSVKRDVDMTVLDDGTPPAYEVEFIAARGVSVDGKLPAGLEADDIGGLLGLSVNGAAARTGLQGEPDADKVTIAGFGQWLPELDQGTLRIDDGAVSVTGVVSPGADLDLVRQGMARTMGQGVSLDLSAPSILPPRGTVRTNVLTQLSERFMGVAWMPVLQFDPSVAGCEAQTNAALAENKVSFVTGSARLDAQSVRALNLVGAIVRRCVERAGLKAEVQGHTDAQGSDANNQALSQRRADSVVEALVTRGVPAAGLTGVGYGESQPIADNGTAEGRAANRRTTLKWSQ